MKMIVLVPNTDQMKVIATATIADTSPDSRSVWMKPSPTALRTWLRIPSPANTRSATMPMTTQEIAVGRK